MEATEMGKALINHINITFDIIEQLSEHPGYNRPDNDDTDHMFTVENIYSSYLNSIYNDLFILTNIDKRYNIYASAVIKLINQKREIVNTKLTEIIEKLNGLDSSYI